MADDVSLRDVCESDLPIFFEHQRDPESVRRAAFPARAYDAFMTHWAKCLANPTGVLKTVVFRGAVAGNVVCWEQAGDRNVGYWLGREYWGQGIASAALAQFLRCVTARPLHAHVAKHNAASIRVLQKCGFRVVGEAALDGADGTPGEELILRLEAGR